MTVNAGEDGKPWIHVHCLTCNNTNLGRVCASSSAECDTASAPFQQAVKLAKAHAQAKHNSGKNPSGMACAGFGEHQRVWGNYLITHFAPQAVCPSKQQLYSSAHDFLLEQGLVEKGWCASMVGDSIIVGCLSQESKTAKWERALHVNNTDATWHVSVLGEECPAAAVLFKGSPAQLDTSTMCILLQQLASMHICSGNPDPKYSRVTDVFRGKGTRSYNPKEMSSMVYTTSFRCGPCAAQLCYLSCSCGFSWMSAAYCCGVIVVGQHNQNNPSVAVCVAGLPHLLSLLAGVYGQHTAQHMQGATCWLNRALPGWDARSRPHRLPRKA
jgi:hypothetical protein